MTDIGIHIENAVQTMIGLKITLDTVVPGRALDDNGVVICEYNNDTSGIYWASVVAIKGGCPRSGGYVSIRYGHG